MIGQAVLRPASVADSRQLFVWVNSPDSLSVKALTRGPILLADHEAWLAQRLADAGTIMQIIEVNGVSVGQIRLQQGSSGTYTVDIYIEPNHRGRGLAAWAIAEMVKKLAQIHPRAVVVALVRVENVPSMALFQCAGFVEVDRSDNFVTFERKATL
jgi:RimJ/RimL family protein N-acetyltransferase